MPHISKNKLSRIEVKKLENELVRSFERAAANIKTKGVFHEFFTFTEKVMFAKRLAVIGMLQKGVSRYMIGQALYMSPSTIERMSLKHEKGKYDQVIRQALGKKDIWEILENILYFKGIMPPISGKGRWRTVDQLVYKHKLKKS